MAEFCDLHMHSTASDGTDAPETLPALAKAAGLSAIALTDHDTTAGIPACQAAADEAGVGFIPGIELSADPRVQPGDDQLARGTMHLLGYFVRHDAPELLAIQARLLAARAQRNPRMVQKLNDLGLEVSYEEVVQAAGGRSKEAVIIGRPHIAQVLVNKGYVESIDEAFARYLGEGAAAFTRRDHLSAFEAIDAIHAAGGLATLAHPVQLRLAGPEALEAVLTPLVEHGLDALETRHSDHAPDDVARFERLAQRFNLLTTGGSDYHGRRKDIRLGAAQVPLDVADRLRRAVL